MFLDNVNLRKNTIQSTQNVIDLFRLDSSLGNILIEFNKLLQIILTAPVSSCTADRSFSVLRILKTFLRLSLQ